MNYRRNLMMTTTNILRNLFENLDYDNEKLDNLNNIKSFITRQSTFENVPITASPSEWNQFDYGHSNKLEKTFEITDHENLRYFINEILDLSNRKNHHPEVTIFHNRISIKLYTQDINDITELDIDMSRMIDEIYEDISFIEKV